jgi:hypothetical protein
MLYTVCQTSNVNFNFPEPATGKPLCPTCGNERRLRRSTYPCWMAAGGLLAKTADQESTAMAALVRTRAPLIEDRQLALCPSRKEA